MYSAIITRTGVAASARAGSGAAAGRAAVTGHVGRYEAGGTMMSETTR